MLVSKQPSKNIYVSSKATEKSEWDVVCAKLRVEPSSQLLLFVLQRKTCTEQPTVLKEDIGTAVLTNTSFKQYYVDTNNVA